MFSSISVQNLDKQEGQAIPLDQDQYTTVMLNTIT